MKLQSLLLWAGCILCLAASISCEAGDSKETEASIQLEFERGTDPQHVRLGRAGTETSDVRDRADAAFEEMNEAARTRFKTRVGLQPWPEDLLKNWPVPVGARVVADSIQQQGNRLLLVDLPNSPDEALNSYRDELAARGYHVRRRESGPSGHTLHAERGDDEAILRFFDREHATRLEFLIAGRGSG